MIFRFILIGAIALLVSSPSISNPALINRLIVIDPGHGTIDFKGRVTNPGKVNNRGQREHKLTMDISLRLGEALGRKGARVILTRTPTDYWRESYGTVEDNKNRAAFANELKADAFISIHCDWYPLRKYRGVTTFYARPESKRLGQVVHKTLLRRLKARDRKLVLDSYTVLDSVTMPAVLVECGFLSNREEAKKLSQVWYQNMIAGAMADAIESYFKEVPPVKQTNN